MKKFLPFIILFAVVLIFFWQFLFKGLLPIPSDTIVGLYHPFRDFYAKEYPNGLPFKNYLLTDPIRQQYPWKYLAITSEKNLQFPIWNPYSFGGQPLLANFQTGAFYPLNLIFFILPFAFAWGFFILSQPLLASLFMYLYLNSLKLRKSASILGSIAFAFCGFSISWLEWGNVIHTALWLPLILLGIDRIILSQRKFGWGVLLTFSLFASFSAGHLQIFFYVVTVSFLYLLTRILNSNQKVKMLGLSFVLALIFLILALPQLLSTLNFISLSARNLDQNYLAIAGWFLPWQNLVQFIVPDFFGNPATLNYWGIWNYGEFVGYAGVGTLMLVVFSFFRKDRKTLFFVGLVIVSLIFALPTALAKLPFIFNIPFIATSQPTRLIFIADFSLSILAALGLDYLLKIKNKRQILHVLLTSTIMFLFIWISVLIIFKNNLGENFFITKQNLIFPTAIFIGYAFLFLLMFLFKNKRFAKLFPVLLILILFIDLARFGWKYTPFTDKKFIYPDTKILNYLKNNAGNFRILTSDSRILPPNFSIMYKLQTLDGYDPLYLLNYAELISAAGRNIPNILPPFGFNRIITFKNYNSAFIDLFGVKYILAFDEIDNPNFSKILTEGNTSLYKNNNVSPRAFFVNKLYLAKDKQEAIDLMFKYQNRLKTDAVIQDALVEKMKFDSEGAEVKITEYGDNRVKIDTQNQKNGFLVLTDIYNPVWRATVDGKQTKIFKTDYGFRGIIVPEGKHKIEFYTQLL